MRLRIFTEPQQGATYEQLLGVARATEAAGLDAFFRSDHYHHFAGNGLPGPTDAWTTLAGLARETKRIRLGTLVSSATFRYPGVLAIQVAQVDAMSGGRVELGLGAGWMGQEHEAYAIPFPPLGQRFEMLEDQLQILHALWTTEPGTPVTFEGRHHSVTKSPGLPKPVQRPHPPIIVGGGGPRRTPRLAAQYADEFNLPPSPHTPERAGQAYARVRAACERHGRDPDTLALSAAKVVCVGADDAEVARRAEAMRRPLDMLRRTGFCGTPEQVAEQLHAYAAVGASRIYLQFFTLDDLEHVAIIGEELAPLVAEA